MTTQFTLSPHAQATTPSASMAAAALCARLLLSAVFLISGVSKFTNPEGTLAYIASAGLPFPEFCFGMAVLIEILGAILLIVGYKTRLVAVLLAIFSIVTAAAFHFQIEVQGQFIHFLKNLAIAGGLLQVAAFGPGDLSVDGRH
jgi:putative oxidoreductase